GNRRRALPAALAGRSAARLRAHRARDPERLHNRLRAARPRRHLSPRPRRRRSGAAEEIDRAHASGLFRRWTRIGKMTRKNILLWIERGLLATGVALGAWCAAVLLEARFHNSIPINTQQSPVNNLVVTQTAVPVLPGDAGAKRTSTRAAPAPPAGPPLGRLAASAAP